MYVKQAVGDKLYLWTNNGPITAAVNKSVIISAHGIQAHISSSYKPPAGIECVFYGPHGQVLSSPSIEAILSGRIYSYEKKPAAKVQDYSLSKFQGEKHGSKEESYAAIATWGKTVDEKMKEFEGISGIKREQIEEFVKSQKKMDIITVRHRKMMRDPTLKEIIGIMEKAGFHYQKYHCSFCRGGNTPFTKDVVHDVGLNERLHQRA